MVPPRAEKTAIPPRAEKTAVPARGQTRGLTVTKSAVPTATKRPVPGKSTVDQPTQAQLARAKSTTTVKASASRAGSKVAAAAASKPVWGRPAAAAKKPAAGKGKVVPPAQIPLPPSPKRGGKGKKEAVNVPLPPSPNARDAVEVPLPPSPKSKPVVDAEPVQADEGSDLESVHEDVVDDDEDVIADVRPAAVLSDDDDDDVFADVRPAAVSSEDVELNEDAEAAADGNKEDAAADSENDEEAEDQPVLMVTEPSTLVEQPEPPARQYGMPPQTPISSLLSSIERGFMYTPGSPLSPPIKYSSHANRPALPPCPFLKPQTSESSSDLDSKAGKEERQALGVVEINQYQ